MSEKIILVHDTAIYDALRKQAKTNRRFKVFAALVTAYIFLTVKERFEQKKAREDVEAEKE